MNLRTVLTMFASLKRRLLGAIQWDEWRGDFDGRVVMRTKRLCRARGRAADLHQFIAADAPGCFHTHPARAIRLVFWGGYIEEVEGRGLRTVRPLTISFVEPELSHRVDSLLNGRSSLSLWLRGRKRVPVQLRGDGWGDREGMEV